MVAAFQISAATDLPPTNNSAAARFLSPFHVFFFISFMHFERKAFRALPWRPFSSACFEHSIDSALEASRWPSPSAPTWSPQAEKQEQCPEQAPRYFPSHRHGSPRTKRGEAGR
jgi:hypothetical protein